MNIPQLFLSLSFCLAAALHGQTGIVNGDFEQGSPGQTPPGWGFGSSAGLFTGAITNQGCAHGSQCVTITGQSGLPASAFGNLSQGLSAASYLTTHIRYRAAVRVDRSTTHAQLWLRVDRSSGGFSFFDNMSDRPVTSTGWSYYTIEADVPLGSSQIVLGLLLTTSGQCWFDDASLEITPGPLGLTNADFEQGSVNQPPPGWTFTFTAPGLFTAAVTNQNCAHGSQCATLTGQQNLPANSFGNLSQSPFASGYLRTHVRYRAAVRVGVPATHAQLWLRVDRAGGGSSFFDNMSNRPITSTTWNYYTIEADIPADTSGIVLGILLTTPGQAWFDDASLDILHSLQPPEPPAPLTDAGLANLVAFARLAGYVRYFHPSDQSASLDWDHFVINGINQIEPAAGPADLAKRLQTLFAPVAPTVRVFTPDKDPGLPPELHPPGTGTVRVTEWFHQGLGIGTTNSLYSSQRKQAALVNGKVPDSFADPAAPYRADIGGVIASVPNALYVNGTGTIPNASPVTVVDNGTRDATDRSTRLAGVILAWNVFQHFYPYFDYEQVDMPGELSRALTAAAQNTGTQDFLQTLQSLVAALHDGHGTVGSTALPTAYWAPLVWTWAENQLIVTTVNDDQGQEVQPGDRILNIDGVAVEDLLAQTESFLSAATPQWLLARSVMAIDQCTSQTRTMQLDIEPYAAQGTLRTVQFSCKTGAPGIYTWNTEARPPAVAELQPGYMYLDINRLTAAAFNAALPKLQTATGIIVDFRAYPLFYPLTLLQHLTQTTINSEQFFFPAPTLPDQVNIKWIQGGIPLGPVAPYLSARRVFLIDARAISQSETDMDYVEAYHLADFVGEPTAGTTGDVNSFNLPGGFSIVWTDLRVLKPDGSRFWGVGIQPTVPASRTRDGIAAGQDEILAKGLAVLQAPPSQ